MLLQEDLCKICMEQGVSIAVAESCTSGTIASKITSISGSSSYFKGGIIAYQNEIKTKLLGVSEALIDNNTEVSAEVVSQMAKSVKKSFFVDYSVATSGYAGPIGGTLNNPIGTVFIAISNLINTEVNRFVFKGSRESIVNQASEKSLELLCRTIKKQQ
jgi:nicotinamide-nucleotide amidase